MTGLPVGGRNRIIDLLGGLRPSLPCAFGAHGGFFGEDVKD
jgi:hypothetical protein